jgi:hypothetical protein
VENRGDYTASHPTAGGGPCAALRAVEAVRRIDRSALCSVRTFDADSQEAGARQDAVAGTSSPYGAGDDDNETENHSERSATVKPEVLAIEIINELAWAPGRP